MLIFVHTVTLVHDDFEVSAQFYHAVSHIPREHRIQLDVLAKRVAISFRRCRRNVTSRRVISQKRHVRVQPSFRRLLQRISIGNQVPSSAASSNNDITPVTVPTKEEEPAQPLKLQPQLSEAPNVSSDVSLCSQALSSEATAQQTSQWLQSNRFGSYIRTFSNFSGADIKRLSKEDLIQICGLPDGIRLFNALHSKSVAPCLTVYLCLGQDTVYRALYLDNFSSDEMMQKIATLLGLRGEHVREIFLQGPGGIHIHISDDVVRNFKDESLFTIEIIEDPAAGQYRVLLKPSAR